MKKNETKKNLPFVRPLVPGDCSREAFAGGEIEVHVNKRAQHLAGAPPKLGHVFNLGPLHYKKKINKKKNVCHLPNKKKKIVRHYITKMKKTKKDVCHYITKNKAKTKKIRIITLPKTKRQK